MNSLFASHSRSRSVLVKAVGLLGALAMFGGGSAWAAAVAQSPLYLGLSAPALIMLTMERDHKLYYEAYNDASDVNGDGILDVRYNPALPDPSDPTHVKIIDYAGYFDSHRCYSYSGGVFTPVSTTLDKKCSGTWSGDFLNYLTTSRMDAMRRVLYGGMRSTDTTSETVLERSHIPQDAHSWGKEYTSTAVDGYDIADYAPLSQPTTGTRHLFANTTLRCPSGNGDPGCSSNAGLPLLRVLTNSSYRVWEWLSIERPVAGVQCATSNNSRATCAHAGSTEWEIVPSSAFGSLTQTTYNTEPLGHVYSYGDMVSRETSYGIPSSATCPTSGSRPTGCKYGVSNAANINGSGNPNAGSGSRQDNFLTVFEGTLVIPQGQGGSYTFAVDGDDGVDVLIDGNLVASFYGSHASCNCQTHSDTVSLTEGGHTIKFRHQEVAGDANYYLYWRKDFPASTMTDYVVRAKTCVTIGGKREAECRGYPSAAPTIYKPAGILQEYGSSADQMVFGLLTGSYAKNTSGGVLRKNISPFTDELDPDTGIFTNTRGIVWTIDHLKTTGFGSSYSYDSNCGVPEVDEPLKQGDCRMWGNPVAEMMFEGLRYFGGKTSPTADYSISSSGNDDASLLLPLPNWVNPYGAKSTSPVGGGYPKCSKPSQMVISDINPTNDTDLLPGRHGYSKPDTTASFSGDTSLNGKTIDVEDLADTIWAGEYGSATPSLFIGQSGEDYDGAPTPKVAHSFGSIRGLSPEEPTREGGFYAGSVALFGKTNDINAALDDQKVDTYSIALASPLPRIVFPVGSQTITLVPFAKTVGGSGDNGSGCGNIDPDKGEYQPTNIIVDFYVDTIKNTDSTNQDSTVNNGRAYAKFRINYEDSEYGSDHDMDAIVEYELTLKPNNTVDVRLTSGYAAGSCIQHMGYVISGTTADGVYLEVRDSDTGSGRDVNYYLDTPNDSGALPLVVVRNFTQGTSSSAAFVGHDPLWYAAKWGGFLDANENDKLDGSEWDTDGNGVPDTYFLVTNAGRLKQQLTNAFNEIVKRDSSASSVATNSTSAGSDTLIFQARFNSGDWSGEIRALEFLVGGVLGDEVWNTHNPGSIPAFGSRKIFSLDPTLSGSKGIGFCWSGGCFPSASGHLNAAQKQLIDPVSFADNKTSSPILDYLRGDSSLEKRKNTDGNGGDLRNRPTTVLGDIVNSDPVFVGTQSYGYEDLPASAPERSSYSSFRSGIASRGPMLYVGANDGMFHGFDARTGVEQFAYVPNLVITDDLRSLSSAGYQHRYFVDGSPSVGDAYFSNGTPGWRTLLISTTGAGGRGIFALDITDPVNFGTGNVLWEFGGADDADLGTTIPQAAIARLANGKWGAIVANGYNSGDANDAADDKAVLFVLDLETGAKIAEIVADASAGNGLSSPIAVDVDATPDRIADYVYAGDLKGNLWKFDLTDPNPANWKVAYNGSPLYVATDTASPPARQPITAKPQVGPASLPQTTGVMVYFGTGKYFEVGDNVLPASPQVQTFYGLWDQCDKTNAGSCDGTLSGRSSLQQQEITFEGDVEVCEVFDTTSNTCTATTTATIRASSANEVDYTSTGNQKGWYLDLISPTGGPKGERVVSTAVLRGSRVIFATLVPSPEACDDGGTSWLMELGAGTGQSPQSPVLDLNNDGKIDDLDKGTSNGNTYIPSGLLPQGGDLGIFKTPTILDCGGKLECKLFSGSSAKLGILKEGGGSEGGGMKGKRRSWRQLR